MVNNINNCKCQHECDHCNDTLVEYNLALSDIKLKCNLEMMKKLKAKGIIIIVENELAQYCWKKYTPKSKVVKVGRKLIKELWYV